jgi:hypothetical protein
MLDGGTFILVGMREWVDEGLGSSSRTNEDKNVRYCDLLEVYNSMERDILRRTHNIFSSLKDESGNKYDDIDNNVTFVDENTIKYQGMIKKMEGKKTVKGSGSGSGSGSSEEDDDDEELHVQATVITTNVKHVGKGVIVQSYEISDDDDDDNGNNDDNENQNDRGYMQNFNKVTIDDNTNTNTYATSNKNKKIVYEVEKNINVDDI